MEEGTENSFKTGEDEENERLVDTKFDFMKDIIFFLQLDPPNLLFIIYTVALFLWTSAPIIDPSMFWGGAVHLWETFAFFKLNLHTHLTYDTNQIITWICLGFIVAIFICLYITYFFKSAGSKIGDYFKALSLFLLLAYSACSFEIITMQVGITNCSSLDVTSQTATLSNFPDVQCYSNETLLKMLISMLVIGGTFLVLLTSSYLIFTHNPKKWFSATSSIPFIIIVINGAANQLIVESLTDTARIFAPLVFSIMNLINAAYVVIFAPFFSFEANSIFTAQFLAKCCVGQVAFLCYGINGILFYFFPDVYNSTPWPYIIGYVFSGLFFVVLIISLIAGFGVSQVYQRVMYYYRFHHFCTLCSRIDPARLEELTNNKDITTETLNQEKVLYQQTVEKCRKMLKRQNWITKSIQLFLGEKILTRFAHKDLESFIKVLDDPLKGNLSCAAYSYIALYLILYKKQAVTPLYYLNKAKKKARTFIDRAAISDYQMLYEGLNDDGGGASEVRKILKNAKKLEETHNSLVEAFFRCLRDDKALTRFSRMLNICAEIANIRKDLDHMYGNITSKHHRMPIVLRQYAEYLKDIEFLEEKALEISAKAQEYEEERLAEKRSKLLRLVDNRKKTCLKPAQTTATSLFLKSGTFLYTRVASMLRGEGFSSSNDNKIVSEISEKEHEKFGKKPKEYPTDLEQPNPLVSKSPFDDQVPSIGIEPNDPTEEELEARAALEVVEKHQRKYSNGLDSSSSQEILDLKNKNEESIDFEGKEQKKTHSSDDEDMPEKENQKPKNNKKLSFQRNHSRKFVLAKRKKSATDTSDSDENEENEEKNKKNEENENKAPTNVASTHLQKKAKEELLGIDMDILAGAQNEEKDEEDDDPEEIDKDSLFIRFRESIRTRFDDKWFYLIALLFGPIVYAIIMVGANYIIFLSMGTISEYNEMPAICYSPRIPCDVVSRFRITQREMLYNTSATATDFKRFQEENMKLVPALQKLTSLATLDTKSFAYKASLLTQTAANYIFPIVSANGTTYGTKYEETNFLSLVLIYVSNVKHLLYIEPQDILTGSTETYFLEHNSGTVSELMSSLCMNYANYFIDQSIAHPVFIWFGWAASCVVATAVTIAYQVLFCCWSINRSRANSVFLQLDRDVVEAVCEEMKDRNRFIKNQNLNFNSLIFGRAICTRFCTYCCFFLILLFSLMILTMVVAFGTIAFKDKVTEAIVYQAYGSYTTSLSRLMDSYESYLMQKKLASTIYKDRILTNITQTELNDLITSVSTTYNNFIYGNTGLNSDSRFNTEIYTTFSSSSEGCKDLSCLGVAPLNLYFLRTADDIASTNGLSIKALDSYYDTLRAQYNLLQSRLDTVVTMYANFKNYAKFQRLLMFILIGEVAYIFVLEILLLLELHEFSLQLYQMKFLLNYLPFEVLEDNLVIKEYLQSGRLLNREKSIKRVDKTQAIIDASESAIFITNEEMGVKILNKTAKEMFKLSSQSEAFGVPIQNFFHPSHKKEIKKIYKRLFKSISDGTGSSEQGSGDLNSEVVEIAGLRGMKTEKRFPTFVQFATARWGNKKIMAIFIRDTSDDKRRRQQFEEEKRKSEKLLLNVLPPEVAKRIQKGEKLISFAHKDVTILFSDIQGFTKLSSTLNPTELVEYLNLCVNSFDDLAMKHKLEKIKTIGDAYFVTGGLYDGTDDHPLRVALMGLDMLIAIKQLSEFNVNIRIGISTGACISGVVGVTKFGFDLYGETVDVASLMEQTGVAGKVHVSETTYTRISKFFKFTERNEVVYKSQAGFAGEIQMKTFLIEGLLDSMNSRKSPKNDMYSNDLNE